MAENKVSAGLATPSPSDNSVETPLPEYLVMRAKWDPIDDLMGGTATMRDRTQTYLPKEEAERVLAYDNRLARSFLFGGLADTIKRVVTKPFSKPITIQNEDKLSAPLDEISFDVDKTGKNISALGAELLEDGAKYGKAHVLVDFPQTSGELTLEQERGLELRPLFVRVSPQNLIGWQTEKDASGRTVLTQIRFLEVTGEPDGKFGTAAVERVRVYTVDTWEVWVKKGEDKDAKFVLESEGTHTFGAVPFFTFYTERQAFMISTPPFEELADMNIAHWQSMSDQRNILRFARVATLFISGMTDDELEDAGGLIIGANAAVRARAKDANMKYVEHSGKAIQAGEEDLRRLEERMEVLGMQPFVIPSGNQTATGKAIDEAKQQSEIQAWITALENLLEECYHAAAKWMGIEIKGEFSVDIFNDFGLGLTQSKSIDQLIVAKKNNQISLETFLNELKRNGLLSDNVVVEEEIMRLEDEDTKMLAEGFNQLPTIEDEEEDDFVEGEPKVPEVPDEE